MTAIWRIRAVILALAGVLAVHHGRYVLAPRHHDHALASAHAYLTWLIPLTGALLFLAVVHLGARLCRPGADAAPALPSTRTLWVAAAGCLLTVYVAQEAAETLFAHGTLPAPAELVA